MIDTNRMSDCLSLLSLAGTIRKYEDALTRATGEQFNLFNILRIGHYEVRTHSPILAELLNPNGSHGQGEVFLKHFLTELEIHDFDAASARVDPEVSIGELGRLDIEIKDRNNRRIIIENKIYAGEQERQLERYHIHDPNADLLFLTLKGDDPINLSTNPAYKSDQFKKVFKTVSYNTNIVRWLESCRKEAATAPSVREAITQYIHLINRLTQQNTSALMNEEIIKKVTGDPTTYLAYASLRNSDGEIRKAIIEKVNEQLDELGKALGLETLERFRGLGVKEEQFYFTTPTLKSQNLRFGLRCSSAEYQVFYYGFTYINPKESCPIASSVLTRFKEVFSEEASHNPFWVAVMRWDQHCSWDDEYMAAIISGKVAPDLDPLIRKLDKVAKEF